jgi:transcriptional antiterminator RfaH
MRIGYGNETLMGTEALPRSENESVPIDASSRWYVLQCKPNQVARASQNLANQGFDTWCPMLKVKRLVRRESVTCREPVFPGYLFVRLEENNTDWRALNATRGVARVVSFNGLPFPASDVLIAGLKQLYYDSPSSPQEVRPLYRVGERVRIIDGCFRDIGAIVQAVTADERVVVLMRIMNGEHALTMDVRQLVAVD